MGEHVHHPVLLVEAVAALGPTSGRRYLDGTVGLGGHAGAVLEASGPDGWLYGCDRDGEALEVAGRRLAGYAGRFELRHGNFDGMAAWVPAASVDGVLLDLGVSSPQLDRPERGFSFQADGPLDMRMDGGQGRTAASWVNEAGADELARIFWELGQEPEARRLARGIERERRGHRIETTAELAGLIERMSPRRGPRHPATRVFQALRMVVNDELGSLQRGLGAAFGVLRVGGRLVTITFHSLEERVVKEFGREMVRDYDVVGGVDVPELRQPRPPRMRWVTKRAVCPGERELLENPRARSAQMRVLEKV